ncbi:MAG: hypothetical protein KF837_21485, partial [Labilithrix sp.]|nr:hypothetical protein [Labilithrix sp.]
MLGARAGLGRITFTACVALAAACGPPSPAENARHPAHPDVRFASGRPPVVVVGREGDPAAAIAVAVTTTGVGWDGAGDDPEPPTALAALVETRLRARAIDVAVVPAWDGFRASALVSGEAEGVRVADAIRDALSAPITDVDLGPARRKLAALGQRPLHDKSLERYARCVGEPWGIPERTKDYEAVDAARLERWRAGAFGLSRVALAATGRAAIGEAVARAILSGPAWKIGAPIGTRSEPAETIVDAYEGLDAASPPGVFVTLDVGPSSAAIAAAEALGDPKGPLAARLAELDPPFRVREVTGAAHARGGCAGILLEATTSSTTSSSVADAAALVKLEASARLAELGPTPADGRVVARRSGDAREAAERAAWWALVDQGAPPKPAGGSVTLVLPSKRGTKEDASAVLRDSLSAAVTKATAAWTQPVVEAKTRVEAGQGEAWVLVGSPCGADGETDAEAGLSAIFASAAADMATSARGAADVAIEPWVAIDGVGLLAHGAPRANEPPASLARRLADVATRALAAEPIDGRNISRARADLLRRDAKDDGPVIALLASQLAPTHSSWIDPWGSSEPIARSSDASVLARAQSLRAGPLRVAVLANADASQAEAAVRAADRWVARRAGEPRVCRAPAAAQPPRPGTYLAPLRPGA